MARTTKGRQKIELKKITDKHDLLNTFSKRRSGLFKKASELCTLCGVELAIFVFYPAGRVFTFGHPCVNTVVDKFLLNGNQPDSPTHQLVEAHQKSKVQGLNLQLAELQETFEVEKNRGYELARLRKEKQEMHWWENQIPNLGLEELERLKIGLSVLKRQVQSEKLHMCQLMVPNSMASGSGGGYAVPAAAEPGAN